MTAKHTAPTMRDLLSCPFCGGPAEIEEVPSGINDGVSFSVGCGADEANCMGYQSLTTFARRSDAVSAWNKRAALSQAEPDRLSEEERATVETFRKSPERYSEYQIRVALLAIIDRFSRLPSRTGELTSVIYEQTKRVGATFVPSAEKIATYEAAQAARQPEVEPVAGQMSEHNEAIEEAARVCDRWIRSKQLHEHLAAQAIQKEILSLRCPEPQTASTCICPRCSATIVGEMNGPEYEPQTAPASIVTCCVTGAIPGDGGACGDCDPCLMGEASVPEAVKRLIAEKNSLIQRVGEFQDDAERYRYLRSRPDDTIGNGGVFAGMTPPTGSGGYILTGDDLDCAVDSARNERCCLNLLKAECARVPGTQCDGLNAPADTGGSQTAPDDEATKYDDPRFNEGVLHVVDLLAKTIGSTDWVAGDGSEDYDEDLATTLLNILAANGLYDRDEGMFATLPAAPADAVRLALADEMERWREDMVPRPADEYHEDMGSALWWKFPIEEPPYVGGPNNLGQTVEVTVQAFGVDKMMRVNVGGWPGYHTHFTPIPLPAAPKNTDKEG